MGAPLDQYDSAYTAAEALLKIKYGENKNKCNILNPRIKLIINKQLSNIHIDIKIEKLSPMSLAFSNKILESRCVPFFGSLSPDSTKAIPKCGMCCHITYQQRTQ
jgi:hypothetical protein